MKSIFWLLLIGGVIGLIVWLALKVGKSKSAAPVVVSQAPNKQTSAQKASEWLGVIGSLNDPIQNLKSIFSNGTAAASAT